MKSKHISQFDEFRSSINESRPNPFRKEGKTPPQFNKFMGITPKMISEKGLETVITEDFFLDLWFDSYFKNRSGDSSYDYRRDDDFWNHTDEILDPETDQEREILKNPSTFESYHNHHWAEVLNYIISKKPNPFGLNAGEDALQNVIEDALSDFKSSRRYS